MLYIDCKIYKDMLQYNLSEEVLRVGSVGAFAAGCNISQAPL